jgi:dedicator of cytokinesis protein 3
MLEPRPVTQYFLVVYFGPFPLAVRNRRFVYRGADWEKLPGFVDRLQSTHPAARLLTTDSVSEDLRSGSELCIQVLPVVPEPDRSKPVFQAEVPREIRSYYETRCGPMNCRGRFSSSFADLLLSDLREQ